MKSSLFQKDRWLTAMVAAVWSVCMADEDLYIYGEIKRIMLDSGDQKLRYVYGIRRVAYWHAGYQKE